jgi:sterol desaturase/sphingolipid hydroxylase (fatty acid hydroxylase superfamily)
MFHAAAVRLTVFFIVLGLLVLWEQRAEFSAAHLSSARRWSTNLGMGFLDTLIVRLIFPAGAVGAAMLAATQHAGLFNHLPFTRSMALVTSVVLLDLTIYLQHRLFHAVPWLWRIHRVHHADPELDASTGLRFHPFESVLSMLLKTGVVFAFGMSALAVLIFEILLNATAMFNHANASLPPRLQRWLSLVMVTPDMHRIHHSTQIAEANRNFGFCIPWWDRLLGSYRAPRRTTERSPIGLPNVSARPEHIRLPWLLLLPFRS